MTWITFLALAIAVVLCSARIEAKENIITPSKKWDLIVNGLPYQNEGLYAGAIDALNRMMILENNRLAVETEYMEYINAYYSKYQDINVQIHKIRWNERLTENERIARIAEIVAQTNITYGWGKGPFGWTTIKDDLMKNGEYYHDGMVMDCSSFSQYVFWLATGKITGQGTAQQCEVATETKKQRGCFAFHYDYVNNNQGGDNHVAIYLGNNLYAESSSANGGVRIKDITGNEFYKTFFTYYATLDKDPNYYGKYGEYKDR